MALDLTSFKKAVNALAESINSYETNQNNESLSDKDMETLKSGVIQNFEVTYELSWKFMKRWLEKNAGSEITKMLTMKELFRIAAERYLIKKVENWFDYQESRNLSSHTYNQQNADIAFESARKFVVDANELLKNLEAKND